MSERHADLLFTDILDAIDKILLYTKGMTVADFAANQMTIDAVVRNFEIIGEASNRLPVDIKTKYGHIDWQRMRGFRNRIVHDYFDVDVSIVWNIKDNYLQQLQKDIKSILK